jgi:hypothetical protein
VPEENPMSATTPRTISNAPDLRQLMAAVGALILAVALLVAVTLSRQVTFQAAAPAAEPATVAFDHGWSTAAVQRTASPAVNSSTGFVVKPSTGGILYMGIPYPAPASTTQGLLVATQNGGIRYMGIPYPAPGTDVRSGSNGTQFAR